MAVSKKKPPDQPIYICDINITWPPQLPGLAGRNLREHLARLERPYALKRIEFLIDGINPVARFSYSVKSGEPINDEITSLAMSDFKEAVKIVIPEFAKED